MNKKLEEILDNLISACLELEIDSDEAKDSLGEVNDIESAKKFANKYLDKIGGWKGFCKAHECYMSEALKKDIEEKNYSKDDKKIKDLKKRIKDTIMK